MYVPMHSQALDIDGRRVVVIVCDKGDNPIAAITDAGGRGARTVGQAVGELAKGDREAAKGNETSAIEHYRLAWEQAEEAADLGLD